MDAEITRRGFFRSIAQPADRYVTRPPGFDSARFSDLCTKCDACLSACPEGIIVPDRNGRAMLDISERACTFCGACAEVCPTGALSEERVEAWPFRANVGTSCLSQNGVMCRTCQESCEARAIEFRLNLGGRADPLVDLDLCTGCGACLGACPVGAIELAEPDIRSEATA